jgi:hypothetical protein
VTRLKRGAAFVAIVWTVAATFVAFDVIALRGLDLAMAYPELFGDVLLSPGVSGSTTCVRADRGQEATTGRAAAFSLGVAVGREAIFRQFSTSDTQLLAAISAHVQESASTLGVPAPEAFQPVQLANANREFVAWVEADSATTARTLAQRYSGQACQVYKLGTVWGYSEVVRMVLPAERAVFAAEIRHYAREAGLPDELWQPMVGPFSAEAGSADLEAQMSALTANVVNFLTAEP